MENDRIDQDDWRIMKDLTQSIRFMKTSPNRSSEEYENRIVFEERMLKSFQKKVTVH